MALRSRRHQCRRSAIIGSEHVGSPLQEQLKCLLMGGECGDHQCRRSRVIARIRIGTLIDQSADPMRITGLGGSHQLGIHGPRLRSQTAQQCERAKDRDKPNTQ